MKGTFCTTTFVLLALAQVCLATIYIDNYDQFLVDATYSDYYAYNFSDIAQGTTFTSGGFGDSAFEAVFQGPSFTACGVEQQTVLVASLEGTAEMIIAFANDGSVDNVRPFGIFAYPSDAQGNPVNGSIYFKVVDLYSNDTSVDYSDGFGPFPFWNATIAFDLNETISFNWWNYTSDGFWNYTESSDDSYGYYDGYSAGPVFFGVSAADDIQAFVLASTSLYIAFNSIVLGSPVSPVHYHELGLFGGSSDASSDDSLDASSDDSLDSSDTTSIIASAFTFTTSDGTTTEIVTSQTASGLVVTLGVLTITSSAGVSVSVSSASLVSIPASVSDLVDNATYVQALTITSSADISFSYNFTVDLSSGSQITAFYISDSKKRSVMADSVNILSGVTVDSTDGDVIVVAKNTGTTSYYVVQGKEKQQKVADNETGSASSCYLAGSLALFAASISLWL